MAFSFQPNLGTDWEKYRQLSQRREVIYQFPNGGATLMGLLSLMPEEASDSNEFTWLEDRWREKAVLTVVEASNGAWTTTAGATATTFSQAAGTSMRLKVADVSYWRVDERVRINRVGLNPSGTQDVTATITVIDTVNNRMTVRFDEAVEINNGVGVAVGNQVVSMGMARAEGADVGEVDQYRWPLEVGNFMQIFREPFAFTNSALAIGQTFDKSGNYKDRARQTALAHMVKMENAFLFGMKGKTTVQVENTDTPQRTMGGVYWFLKEYEKAGGGVPGYRPGGAAQTLVTDDDKRIIDIAGGGTITKAVFESYLERLFRVTSNTSFEKVLLCGSGLYAAIADFYEGKMTVWKDLETTHKLGGFQMHCVETKYGTLFVKTHPRFNANPAWRYDGFALDLGNLRYRYLNHRDTMLLKNRQSPGADFRKDEFLTECSLECRLPETHMYIRNLKGITA